VAMPSPTVLKRYIALELRRMRESRGIRREEVAARLRSVVSHVTHLETMRNLPRAAELEVLLEFYGAGERIPAFLDLLDAARRGRDWWQPFKDAAPDWFDLFLGMESSADQIESYDVLVVPGLFQTERYTEAVIRAGQPNLPEDELARRVALRKARQDVLHRKPDPPLVRCVLDESVLLRTAGTADVMAEQVRQLVVLSRQQNVTIQLLPLAAGLHAGIDGGFTVLTFPPELAGDPGVVYIDSQIRGTYYEDPAHILRFRNTLADIRVAALSPADTRDRLTSYIEELS
jgi:transcriptional regulator with XRE-family HTH domain